ALLVGRLLRVPAALHLIGGPEEWLGGGWRSDNKVLGRLRRPSRILETLLLGVIRRLDAVATMGPAGEQALIEKGIDPGRVIQLPAAVDTERFQRRADGDTFLYDVVSITSLIPRKRPWDILSVLRLLQRSHPQLRAAIVG